MSASVLVRNSHRDSNSVKPPKFTLASALLVATALTLVSTDASYAQSTGPLQQWAGINNGVAVGFDTPQEACESDAGQYIPYFGRTVGALTSFNPAPDTENPYTGIKVPAYDCHYSGDTIRSLLGCTNALQARTWRMHSRFLSRHCGTGMQGLKGTTRAISHGRRPGVALDRLEM